MPKLCICAILIAIGGIPTILAQETKEAPPPSPRDLKGNVFIIIHDGQPATKTLADLLGQAQDDEPEFILLDTSDPAKLARDMRAFPAKEFSWLSGIIELQLQTGGSQPAGGAIEVYHYPFESIAREHIQSPEYTFKFASDSALLAINLAAATRAGKLGPVELRPMERINARFPRELLRKYVRLTWEFDADPQPQQLQALAETLRAAIQAYQVDARHYVMGLLPPKVRRHASLEHTVIQLHRHIYPDREFTEEEQEQRKARMAEVIQEVKPFPSGLYFIAGLECLTPYTIEFVNGFKQPDDYWYNIAEARFVTSSVSGIVRTVPGRFEDYKPLPSGYEEPAGTPPVAERGDYVVSQVTVFDGTKHGERFVADVAIQGERIVALGDLRELPRDTTIDGTGLFLTPGFIDIHSHADENVLEVPYAPSHIRQGITTVLGGNCSFSPLGIGAFYAQVELQGAALNIGELVGNRPVRERVLGKRKGMVSYDAIYREKELVDLAMEEGAYGMSSGLIYSISEEAFAWELAALAKQVKPYGGFYASHVRGETDEVLDAVREAIYIGELAEVPVQVSHMKVINKRNWGDMVRYLEIMRAAQARGLDVTGDQYPWRASGPAAHYTLHKLIVREAIRNESPEVVLLKDMPGKYARYSGRPLTELLAAEGITPAELVADLGLTEDSEIYGTYLCLGDEDVCQPMRADFVMVCTDSGLMSREQIDSGAAQHEHPRKFRSYPEFFAHYVRDRQVCSWELAVYKCTGLPAGRMKLADRGVIKPGAYADLVLLDPRELDPGTDYRHQEIPPRGIHWVFINGEPALRDGQMTNVRAGQALRAGGRRKP
ncbi:MAG: amidohydrolase family protein [Planctomycetota bacterium]